MSKQRETDQIIEHDYDGIQEYDNPLPNWWLAIFYLSIVFSAVYVGYYHFAGGPSLDDELAADLAAVRAKQQVNTGTPDGPGEEELLAVFQDDGRRRLGAEQFMGKCASCHGNKGEGSIGPNLTDHYWLHGDGSLPAILQVVSDGVPDKGMPPWKGMLKKDELLSVVAYVRSLAGSPVANGKAPQGTEVKEP
jgi:cytochrome c oxidase cbb3-type subunit 3